MRPMMQEALQFLDAFAESISRAAPHGREEEYRKGAIWYPSEPYYLWRSAYGDFGPPTIRSGIRQGLIEEPRRNGFRLTEAGRSELLAIRTKESSNDQ